MAKYIDRRGFKVSKEQESMKLTIVRRMVTWEVIVRLFRKRQPCQKLEGKE